MEYPHKSVLPAEVLAQLKCSKGLTIVDCTLGGAGHSETILEKIATGHLLAIDQDQEAIDAAQVRLARFSRHLSFFHGNFARIDEALTSAGIAAVDGFLLDLGLSSAQLAPERGFSYKVDAPLDMRFDRAQEMTAANVVNTYSEAGLADLIRRYGEERWASRIARFIVLSRERAPIETTGRLVQAIKEAVPASARRRGGHPAKRTFQALRIEVNNELISLRKALDDMPKWLKPGGRIVVISYHSLEDRIVKTKFKDLAAGCVCPPDMPVCVCGKQQTFRIVTGRPIVPGADELEFNPRARSAKLRTLEKPADANG